MDVTWRHDRNATGMKPDQHPVGRRRETCSSAFGSFGWIWVELASITIPWRTGTRLAACILEVQ